MSDPVSIGTLLGGLVGGLFGGGEKKPKKPEMPAQPELPQAPTQEEKKQASYNARDDAKRRAMARQGRNSTILTGGLGVTGSANTAKKKLLGK